MNDNVFFQSAATKQEPDSEKPLEKLEQVAMMVEDVKPETASVVGEPKKEEKIFDDIDSDENDENIATIIDDDNTWKHGDQVTAGDFVFFLVVEGVSDLCRSESVCVAGGVFVKQRDIRAVDRPLVRSNECAH